MPKGCSEITKSSDVAGNDGDSLGKDYNHVIPVTVIIPRVLYSTQTLGPSYVSFLQTYSTVM